MEMERRIVTLQKKLKNRTWSWPLAYLLKLPLTMTQAMLAAIKALQASTTGSAEKTLLWGIILTLAIDKFGVRLTPAVRAMLMYATRTILGMLGVLGQRLVSMSKRGVSTVLAQILATFASVLSTLSASMSPTLTVVAPAQREHSEAAHVIAQIHEHMLSLLVTVPIGNLDGPTCAQARPLVKTMAVQPPRNLPKLLACVRIHDREVRTYELIDRFPRRGLSCKYHTIIFWDEGCTEIKNSTDFAFEADRFQEYRVQDERIAHLIHERDRTRRANTASNLDDLRLTNALVFIACQGRAQRQRSHDWRLEDDARRDPGYEAGRHVGVRGSGRQHARLESDLPLRVLPLRRRRQATYGAAQARPPRRALQHRLRRRGRVLPRSSVPLRGRRRARVHRRAQAWRNGAHAGAPPHERQQPRVVLD
jgi:hypothetical protein